MRGAQNIIDALNGLLADELAAEHQYLAHYSALTNWGFDGLASLVADRAQDERKHAEALTNRILALEGVPNVAALGQVSFSVSDVPSQFGLDAEAEATAIERYNAAIKLVCEGGDNATRIMLDGIVAEETEHLNEIEGWQDQCGMMGLPAFLTARVKV
jgi:bacterioferritin